MAFQSASTQSQGTTKTTQRSFGKQKRFDERVPMEFKVRFVHSDTKEAAAETLFEAETVDLSSGGLGLKGNHLPNVGTPLNCHFTIPGLEKEIYAKSKVIWAAQEGNTKGQFGVAFEDIENDDRDAIAEVVGWMEGSAEEEQYITIHLDNVSTPLRGKVVEQTEDDLVLEQSLPFLEEGKVFRWEEAGLLGTVAKVEIVANGGVPNMRVHLSLAAATGALTTFENLELPLDALQTKKTSIEPALSSKTKGDKSESTSITESTGPWLKKLEPMLAKVQEHLQRVVALLWVACKTTGARVSQLWTKKFKRKTTRFESEATRKVKRGSTVQPASLETNLLGPIAHKGRYVLLGALVAVGVYALLRWMQPTPSPSSSPSNPQVAREMQPVANVVVGVPQVSPQMLAQPTLSQPQTALIQPMPSSVETPAVVTANTGIPTPTDTQSFGAPPAGTISPEQKVIIPMSQPVRSLRGEEDLRGFMVRVDGALATRGIAQTLREQFPEIEYATIINYGSYALLTVRFIPGQHKNFYVKAKQKNLEVTFY